MQYHINDFIEIMKSPARVEQFKRDHADGEPIELSLDGYSLEERERIWTQLAEGFRQLNPDLVVTDKRGRA